MKTWNNTDKSDWMDGEWKDEPDKAHWVDESTGYDCLIVRAYTGALCGYVGVPEKHKSFGVDYNEYKDINFTDVVVHGGLTFSGSCAESDDESRFICHPKSGAANEKVWWFGFDCAHSGDLCPFHAKRYPPIVGYEEYCNFSYVKSETEYLAKQLKAAA